MSDPVLFFPEVEHPLHDTKPDPRQRFTERVKQATDDKADQKEFERQERFARIKRMREEQQTAPANEAVVEFTTTEATIAEPDPDPIVDSLVWTGEISVLAAESGARKTFILLGVAACVSDGKVWCSRRVKQGSVAYVYFEGNVGRRLEALRVVGYDLTNLYTLRASEPLSPKVEHDGTERVSMGEAQLNEQLDKLRAKIATEDKPPIVLVIIDTVRASLVGNEDSSETISAYLRAVRRLMSPLPTAGTFLAHHTGWQDDKKKRNERERGSSAFRGNVDGTFFVKVVTEDQANHRAYLELKTLKTREDEKAPPLNLVCYRVNLPQREALDKPRTSCVVGISDGVAEGNPRAAYAAAMAAEQEQMDRMVLGVVHDNKITSQAQLRQLLGKNQNLIVESLARLTPRFVALKGRQRDPYLLTSEGVARVTERGFS